MKTVNPELLNKTNRLAQRYFRTIHERPVAPAAQALDRLKELATPMPEQSTKPEDVVELLDEIGSPATVTSAGGRYFGFVIGGSLPAALAANWLCGVWDQNACLRVLSPIGATLEQVAGRWLVDVLSLPADTHASFVTCTTMANVTALAAARHHILTQQGWDVEANGLFNAPEIRVVVGQEAHVTLFRGLALLGLGRSRVETVPVDGQGRMCADRLPDLDSSTIVCIQAGNVNTGAFDPAREICEKARAAGAWVHVDGAFGLWAATSPEKRWLTEGIELADSWATDGHKWLNVSYDNGLAFVRNKQALRKALSFTASYLVKDQTQGDPMDFTPDASRRARGIEIWAALKSLGKSGLAEMIERHCRFARRFAEALTAAGFEVLNEVNLNQVMVSFGEPEKTRRVIRAIQSEGTCWASGTEWQGRTALRISISSWATTKEDVEESIAAIARLAQAEQ